MGFVFLLHRYIFYLNIRSGAKKKKKKEREGRREERREEEKGGEGGGRERWREGGQACKMEQKILWISNSVRNKLQLSSRQESFSLKMNPFRFDIIWYKTDKNITHLVLITKHILFREF